MFNNATFKRKVPVKAKGRISELVLETSAHRWVIPYNCEILKTIIVEKELHANDLQFRSQDQCHGFIKHLLLLAANDEYRHCEPSKIAELARELIFQQSKLKRNCQQSYI